MCGIFGVIATDERALSPEAGAEVLRSLYLLSESRGKEASGLAARTGEGIVIVKQPRSASRLIRIPEYAQAGRRAFSGSGPRVAIGHARLVTNGSMEDNANNQPVVSSGLVGIHNGIIVNDAELWRRFPDLTRRSEVDTEVLLALAQRSISEGESFAGGIARAFGSIEGAASVAVLSAEHSEIVIATNTGSLYLCKRTDGILSVFASERYILEQLIDRDDLPDGDYVIEHLHAGQGRLIRPVSGACEPFALDGGNFPQSENTPKTAILDCSPQHQVNPPNRPPFVAGDLVRFKRDVDGVAERIAHLRRCSRCILPETMPFIEFDDHGVCNYCRYYQPMKIAGPEALQQELHHYRRTDGRPNCLVTFSGGRDSSYTLHYLVRELDMHPIAYSYDWGMLTDLGRRNQARMTGVLGVEHILVSADIVRKRRYIGLNVKAWLRRPDLGTVPLFMAGDKQLFYYANRLRRQTDTPVIIFGENFLEKTDFKYGFCGVHPQFGSTNIHRLRAANSFKMAFYYAGQYLRNPAYLNASLVDTLTAYLSYYVIPHNYLYFFLYIRWDEREIERTLLDQYHWETAPDTKTTWRIGDGTAAFYNYIYYLVAGFTENDTFRSNQIREGMITRAEGLARAARDNQPRYESLRWYADTIGIDLAAALRVIHAMPTRYALT